ncbi:MAG: Holliday junction resolvase RuvX [Candidatus Cloacimonadota bacterium]|nr:Holliday junction resolvase RuvX [Candidatus Cloacimonadota bacterium]
MKRLLAIDYGERHIGIALSDPAQLIAFPYLTIDTKKTPLFFSKIAEIVNKQDIEKVILGIPLNTENVETKKSIQIRNFAKELKQYIDLPIIFSDESCTTQEAIKVLHLKKKSLKKNKFRLDMIAASLILKDYLANRK